MQTQPYLFFDGRCEEAIAFYRQAIGAEVVMLMRYADGPEGSAQCPDGTRPPADKVMHACLQIGSTQVWYRTVSAAVIPSSRVSRWRFLPMTTLRLSACSTTSPMAARCSSR